MKHIELKREVTLKNKEINTLEEKVKLLKEEINIWKVHKSKRPPTIWNFMQLLKDCIKI